jgi:hypothetical protein
MEKLVDEQRRQKEDVERVTFTKFNMKTNPAHEWSLEHEMIVDGVLMQEKKDLIKTLNDETGVEEGYLSRTRVILLMYFKRRKH